MQSRASPGPKVAGAGVGVGAGAGSGAAATVAAVADKHFVNGSGHPENLCTNVRYLSV